MGVGSVAVLRAVGTLRHVIIHFHLTSILSNGICNAMKPSCQIVNMVGSCGDLQCLPLHVNLMQLETLVDIWSY